MLGQGLSLVEKTQGKPGAMGCNNPPKYYLLPSQEESWWSQGLSLDLQTNCWGWTRRLQLELQGRSQDATIHQKNIFDWSQAPREQRAEPLELQTKCCSWSQGASRAVRSGDQNNKQQNNYIWQPEPKSKELNIIIKLQAKHCTWSWGTGVMDKTPGCILNLEPRAIARAASKELWRTQQSTEK